MCDIWGAENEPLIADPPEKIAGRPCCNATPGSTRAIDSGNGAAARTEGRLTYFFLLG